MRTHASFGGSSSTNRAIWAALPRGFLFSEVHIEKSKSLHRGQIGYFCAAYPHKVHCRPRPCPRRW
jgi:hypothetical protein